ncbi:uncharacterized protein CC84DRAFT_403595 [Paraphaeosphaeria sporulosa]|uniref:Uncharacterized protein n=1 Tax=Paraphaeosphaeria sporulosa TaxID=1460663 RepID=A0A177BVM9_9PLEO|nr:uncharacterized protein CC84DRAFT_403595 [Paraphaeosphaeria sporulosa]OAF99452.1 hypothetical protein CC84DRAFT_403595 [Paraphaeosphaeria sporulosa]
MGSVYHKRQQCSTVCEDQGNQRSGRRPTATRRSIDEHPSPAYSYFRRYPSLDRGRAGGGSDWTCILSWVSSKWLNSPSGGSHRRMLARPALDATTAAASALIIRKPAWYVPVPSAGRLPWSSRLLEPPWRPSALLPRCHFTMSITHRCTPLSFDKNRAILSLAGHVHLVHCGPLLLRLSSFYMR